MATKQSSWHLAEHYKRTTIRGRTVEGVDGSPVYLRPLENLLGDTVFPELMRNTRIPKIELQQHTPYGQTLDIRDRTLDGGTVREFWLELQTSNQSCVTESTLVVAADVLRERYERVESVEGRLVVPKNGVRIADLATLLLRELRPYLNIQAVSIINYARTDDSPAEIVDATGRHLYWDR